MASSGQPHKLVIDLLAEYTKFAEDKKYDDALEAVSTALEASEGEDNGLQVTILDDRVALYLQMKKQDLAYNDAKSMILLSDKDGRGYLHCGLIAKSQGELFLAIEFFQQGLEHVTASDSSHILISQELTAALVEVRTQAVVSKASDPLIVLPFELIELILSYVAYRQVVQMLRISKSWKGILENTRPLVNKLVFRRPRVRMAPNMLQAALRRLKVPKVITLTDLPQESAPMMLQAFELRRFKMFEKLDVQGSWFVPEALPLPMPNLKSLILGDSCEVSVGWVWKVLRDCTSLEVAQFARVRSGSSGLNLKSPSLRKLKFHCENHKIVEVSRIFSRRKKCLLKVFRRRSTC